MTSEKIGILGAGRFGTALAVLVARKHDVLIYTRQEDNIQSINAHHKHSYLGYELSPRIKATSNALDFCSQCRLIFPVVPSENFRFVMRSYSNNIKPYHILIHGTKGLDVDPDIYNREPLFLSRKEVFTMSEIIEQETQVLRVGCISGPNLAEEIMDGQPTATVIASEFEEVIAQGKSALNCSIFRVFESPEIRGAELAGAFKNIIAIGSGILEGRGLGKNIQSMLITKGLSEIIYLGKELDIHPSVFLGTAGLGDVIATATSEKSRNYSFGLRIGRGAALEDIKNDYKELVEGVRTLRIAHGLNRYFELHLPITDLLYKIVFDEYPLEDAIKYLMYFPYDVDVGFL
jgi:glycerol-3-phosphate dehydrogenase (NAD(P)+)